MRNRLVGGLVVMTLLASVMEGLSKGKRKKFVMTDEMITSITEAVPEKPEAEPEKKRKVLILNLCKGFRHKSIPVADKAFEIMGKKTGAFEVEVTSDMADINAEKLKEVDALLFNNTTKLVPDDAQKTAIMDFIKGGKGIIGIHGAGDNFYEWPEGVELMGGMFDGHPWRATGTWGIKLDEPDHPLNKAFEGKNFKICDELYQFKDYDRAKVRVLLSVDLDEEQAKTKKGNRTDGDYAQAWIKPVGAGRLFYCGFGHNNEVYWNKAVVKFMLDGIQYALGDLKVEDSPDK
jgi:type 1 glutamine amidotransferase